MLTSLTYVLTQYHSQLQQYLQLQSSTASSDATKVLSKEDYEMFPCAISI